MHIGWHYEQWGVLCAGQRGLVVGLENRQVVGGKAGGVGLSSLIVGRVNTWQQPLWPLEYAAVPLPTLYMD